MFEKVESSIPIPNFATSLSHLFAVLTHNFSQDEMENVRLTGLPIINIHGDEDKTIDVKNSDIITKGLKCKQYILHGHGHGLDFMDPQELHDIISGHISNSEKEWENRKPLVTIENSKSIYINIYRNM